MGFGQEYAKLGIKGYYQQIGDRYTNPHENDIKALIASIAKPELSYLDLGAGNGIVSQALKDKKLSICNRMRALFDGLFYKKYRF